MPLRIRLARGGARHRPFYRIVVADSRSPRDGRFIERLGYYNPLLARDNPERLKFDADRVKYWLGNGAKPSERMARFLGEAGIMTFTQPNRPKKSAPRKKAQERLAAARGGAGAAADEAAAPAEGA